AVKPVTGHSVYASGGIEIAAALLALRHGVIPAITNLETPDAACDLPFVLKETKTHASKIFLFNSFGFGGQNASLTVKKI
ncbi:MAG TPA: beta-ketoacyl-[acyl-carrier-protein] synthase family protein, partial [bacterium]|nr:beta-ketoacyl-[acyl-carrier-protein] synthase family protein [bacterium]